MISTNNAGAPFVFETDYESEGQKAVKDYDITETANNIAGSQDFAASACQPFRVEDIFERKTDLSVEHTPEKEIIQSGINILEKFDNFQSANSSKILNFGTQKLACNFDKCSDGIEKDAWCGETTFNGKSSCLQETDILESEAISQTRTGSNMVQMLWRKIENIALRERAVAYALNKERIENLVSKVEEEVEFEDMVEDMCLRFRAEGEYKDMERCERDLERERREVRLEEEVRFLRNKVEFLQEKINAANANKDIEMQKMLCPLKVQDPLVDVHLLSHFEPGCDNSIVFEKTGNAPNIEIVEHEVPDIGGENILSALREMLSLADEKQEQDRKKLDDILQIERKTWINTQREFENEICILEMELNNNKSMLKEKESALILEKERRMQYGIEAGRILAFWREENLAYNVVCHKLKTIQDILPEFSQKALSSMKSTEEENSLLELLEFLENVVNVKPDVSNLLNGEQKFLWELVESWKSKSDHLEEEIDKLKEQLGEARSTARKILEKPEFFQKGTGHLYILDSQSQKEDRNLTEASISNLRQREFPGIMNSAYDEKAWFKGMGNVQDMVADKDEHVHSWIALANKKEEELVFVRSIYQKIKKPLAKCKKKLQHIKKHVVKQNRGILKEQDNNSNHTDNKSSDGAGSDVEISICTDLLDSSEILEGAGCDIQWLVKDISEEIERISEELLSQQASLERAQTNIRIGTEQLKEEQKELERKVTDTLIQMEELREQIKEKEGQMEWDRKKMEAILAARMDAEENLKQQLHAKEIEIEINAQKFRDQMDAVKEELMKEQKEKEEFTKVQFATRDKLILEMKESEIKWESEFEFMSQEMQKLRIDIDGKNKKILRLENELKVYQHKAVHPKQRKQDVTFSFKDGHDIESLPSSEENNQSEESNMCNFNLGSMLDTTLVNFVGPDVDWQDVVGKVAGFDKQIADAMLAIESLKEELNFKEKELQKARLERDAECKTEWMKERTQSLKIVDLDGVNDVLQDNEDLIQLLEAERADTADAMSILEGAVLELQWALNYYKGNDSEGSNIEAHKEPPNLSKTKGELVKVHASHLQDLNKLIVDLKLKAEQAENRARNAELALAVTAVKEATKCTGLSSRVVKFGNEWFDDGELMKDSMKWNAGALNFASPFGTVTQIERNDIIKTGKTLRNLQQEAQWSGGSREGYQLWDMNASSAGTDVIPNNSSSSWMMVRGCMDDDFAIQDASQQGPLTLAISTPRHQRRWLIDGSWLHNVRKEHALLRRQVEFERQHVSELKQVEAENRWMEATIMQALEQKKESDMRVLELERKVAFLEAMIAQKVSEINCQLRCCF